MSEPNGGWKVFGRHDSPIDAEINESNARRIEGKIDRLAAIFERFANATVDELRGTNKRQGDIMAAIDDLKAAVAGEDAAIDAIVAYLQTLAGTLGTPDADVEAVVADINAHVAELQAALPAPATPAPTDGSAPAPVTTPDVPTDAPVN